MGVTSSKKSNFHHTRGITAKRSKWSGPPPLAQRMGDTAAKKRRNGGEPIACAITEITRWYVMIKMYEILSKLTRLHLMSSMPNIFSRCNWMLLEEV